MIAHIADKIREVRDTWGEVESQDVKIIRIDGGENKLRVAIANHARSVAALPDPEDVQRMEDYAIEHRECETVLKMARLGRLDPVRTTKAFRKLEKERNKLRAAAKAYQALSVCYRIGKRPSEALFKKLDSAKALLGEEEK